MFNYIEKIEEMKKIECFIVLPNYEASIPLQRAGWINVSSMQRFVKIIDINYFLRNKIKFNSIRKFISNSINKIMKVFFFENTLPIEYTYKVTDRLNGDFDKLWNNFDKNNLIIGYRNKEYLEWRFVKHPLVDYKFFLLMKNSSLYGYIVFHKKEGKIYQIDDFLCLDFKFNMKFLFISFFWIC